MQYILTFYNKFWYSSYEIPVTVPVLINTVAEYSILITEEDIFIMNDILIRKMRVLLKKHEIFARNIKSAGKFNTIYVAINSQISYRIPTLNRSTFK